MQNRVSKEDLEHIAVALDDVIPSISGTRFFITGGTGFFGKWLLETILFLNKKYNTNCSVVALSRNPELFINNFPQFNNSSIEFLKGDIKTFAFPEGEFQYCIHAALEGEKLDKTDELEILNAAYEGTHRVLELAKQKHMRSTLFISSGGIYGRQPPDMRFINETYSGGTDMMQLKACYGEGKRVSEYLCTYYGRKHNLPVKIARPFAFVGPYLPLDAHFVIGNFIGNCLRNEPVLIKGDGTPVRSYMYAADLVIYLLKILIHGEILVPYNVGSKEEISIGELAKAVGSFFSPQPEITTMQQKTADALPERYVPENERLTTRFPVKTITLAEAIKKTISFYRND